LIFLDTNVVSETMRPKPDRTVVIWLERNDSEIALPSVAIAEIAFGIQRIRPDERAPKLELTLNAIRDRFVSRIFAFDEDAALIYGRIMGEAERKGRKMATPDGMIAAIALRHGAALATRNREHFRVEGLELIDPWA
jgi:predicted nucleic acid-binding protein